MIALGLIHCDETGTRAGRKTCWVHNASNADYTFLSIHEKCGWAEMNEVGVLPFYHGINPYEAIRSAISGNPDIIFD